MQVNLVSTEADLLQFAPLKKSSVEVLWQSVHDANRYHSFGGRGTCVSPGDPGFIVDGSIFPACTRLGLPRATWLTLRRTYSSWLHDRGVAGKVVAQLMGHANVDTTLNVYTQVLDGSPREAVDKVGSELFTIVHKQEDRPTVHP